MKFYRFSTHTTCYFFPSIELGQEYLYGLYSPYSLIAKIYWWWFRHCKLVRLYNSVDEKNLPFNYEEIMSLCGEDSKFSVNMGSPGIEQKISILGYDTTKKVPFFAKYSQKEAAKKLTENEISVYQKLKSTGLVPELLYNVATPSIRFFKAEFVEGHRKYDTALDETIVNLCNKLSKFHLCENERNDGLKTSLSHGDFCPWNMLVNADSIKLIDWELAAERPLGHDLFTYICQCSNLFNPEQEFSVAIHNNSKWIYLFFMHFNISDWKPYLKAFATDREKYERSKGFEISSKSYQKLLFTLE